MTLKNRIEKLEKQTGTPAWVLVLERKGMSNLTDAQLDKLNKYYMEVYPDSTKIFDEMSAEMSDAELTAIANATTEAEVDAVINSKPGAQEYRAAQAREQRGRW